MRILVTGSSGFLGRAVVERLVNHGDLEIRCFVRHNSDVSGLEAIRSRYPSARLDYVVGNLASPADARRAVQGIEVIYHLAAGMRGLPATIFVNSVVASNCLLEAIQNKKRRVVLISSLGVYGTSLREVGSPIDENTSLDPHAEKRSVYFHAKIRQEQLFRKYAGKGLVDLVVLRPGVLYGRGNPHRDFPSRIGLRVGNLLLVLGGRNILPLSYVVNCAEAVVLAGQMAGTSGRSYNVLDDDLPTAIEYVQAYKQEVRKIATICFPYFVTRRLSRAIEDYRLRTHVHLPTVFTPYETSAMYGRHQFDNQEIKKLGWKQIMPTAKAMHATFASMRASMDPLVQ